MSAKRTKPRANRSAAGTVKLARNRKAFITRHGASCANWRSSWSFVNHRKRFVIFGAWDKHTKGSLERIFSENWAINDRGRRNSGYKQSREHLRLVEKEGYALYTFPMIFSNALKNGAEKGPAKMDGFKPILTLRRLRKSGVDWYATDASNSSATPLPESVDPKRVPAGEWKTFTGNSYERSPEARATCLHYYGYRCQGCGYKMSEIYGEVAERIIHVHHLKPVSKIPPGYRIDAINELVPLCPNCHSVVHAKKQPLTIKQLKRTLVRSRKRSRR